MSILLTGGAGYIGSHTAIELIESGYDVIIADNLSNSNPIVLDRIFQITGKKVKFYEIDVANQNLLENVFLENSIETIIHFAGFKAVGESVKFPVKYYDNNIGCTLSILNMMEKYSVKNIIFSSSATVYGTENKAPYHEKMKTGPCSNPYGWTKLFIEQIISDFVYSHNNISAVLLRYFNPVGAHSSGLIGEDPKDIPNNLMPYIAKVAVGSLEKLNVFGNDYPTRDGTGIRDYIHVVDLAKGHVAAVEYATNHEGTEIINLGTGNGVSVLEMIESYKSACGHDIPYVVVSRRPGDIDICYADCSKAEKILGWKAKLTIDDMCKSSWNWQSKNPNGYV